MTASAIDLALLLGRRFRVLDGVDGTHVMGEGEVIGFCQSPTLVLRADDGTLSHHSAVLPREEIVPAPPKAGSCSQCGQRTPVCAECGDTIIFVPRSGWGTTGEWRHIEPPRIGGGMHMARPKVFVS